MTAVIPPLVGRDRELAILRARLDAAVAGQGNLVLIGGAAGIGKTALAEELCRVAAEQGAVVLTGRCFDLAETSAYGPWRYLFERYPATPDDPPPPPAFVAPGSVGEADSQMLLFQQVRDFLKSLADGQPVVLLLDDAHWSDPASLDLLRFLARSVDLLPLLIVIAYRSDELADDQPLAARLPTLIREAHAERIDLHPLDDAAVQALVTGRYRLPYAETRRLVRHLQAWAEGNPFFLGELLRALEEERVLRRDDMGWKLDDLSYAAVPPLLRQVIGRRFERLERESQRLLTIAAVIGHEVPLALWASVADVDADSLINVLEGGLDAGVLRESPGGAGVQFTHALMREAIFASVSAVRRRPIHRRVGEALMHSRTPDPDAIAYHFQYAGDDRAAAWLIRAGERAHALYAWATALTRYEAALALLGEEEEEDRARERASLLYRLSLVARWEDQKRGLPYIEKAARLAQRGDDHELTARIQLAHGHALCMTNNLSAGVPMMRAAISALEALSPAMRSSGAEVPDVDEASDRSPVVVVAWLAQSGYIAEARALGERYLATHSAYTQNWSEQHALATLYNGLAMAYMHQGRPDAAQETFERAIRLFDSIGHYYLVTGIRDRLLCAVLLQYRADDLAEREQMTREFEGAIVREGEYAGSSVSPRLARLPLLAIEGPWDEVPELGKAAIAGIMFGGSYFAGIVAVAQGDIVAVQSLLDIWLPSGLDTPPGSVRFRPATFTQRLAAAQALNTADLPTARQWLEMHDRWLAWNGAAFGRSESEALWATYHRLAGDFTAAQERARLALAHATEPRQPLALLGAHRLLGELATDAGRLDEARTHLDAALTLADACAAPYERALTLLALAALRFATRDTSEAATLLDQARVICLPLKAAPALARADALATRLAGLRPSHPLYPDGLTAREVEVLRLIAVGRTNQEIAAALFLSIRTVERHITTIYRKIDARGRADATAYAARHALLPLDASPT